MIPKYALIIHSCLHFSSHVFNWLLPDQHKIYSSSINSGGILDLLQCLSNNEYKICEGLRENDYLNSIAKDSVAQNHSSYSVSHVIRQIVPKNIGMERNYRVIVILRSVDCMVLFDYDVSKEQVSCKTCLKFQIKIYQQQTKKERTSNAPARDKAPLAACDAQKLWAAVIADRIRLKDLEARLEKMQQQIEKHDVNVSKPLEKDLLTIMSGQNLGSTPYMKFFWEQQMRLLQTNNMGRRYHPQVIRFALFIHCKSPRRIESSRIGAAIFHLVSIFSGALTLLN